MRVIFTSIVTAVVLFTKAVPTIALTPRSPQAAATSVAVSVRGWVDKDQIPAGSMVRLWLVIENGLPSAIDGIAFDDFEIPGFSNAGCWSADKVTPACTSTGLQTSLPPIASADSLTLWAFLQRNSDDVAEGGKVVLTGTFHWKLRSSADFVGPIDPSAVQHAVISVGPLELLPTVFYKNPILSFIKDLILPVIVGLVGAAGALALYRYQQDRTERHAIWTEMLSKVTHDTEHHYLPIGTAAGEFSRNVDAIHNEDHAVSDERALFAMLAFDSNVRDFFRKKGGWYFKVRPAEDVVEAAWELYKKAQRRAIPREIIDEAIGRIKPNAVYTNCKSTITNVFESVPPSPPNAVARASPQHTVGELFANWIRSDDFKADIPLCFAVIRDVLVIEVNRPFDKWYDTPANKDTLPYDDYIRLLKSREQSLQVRQQQPNEPKIWLDERLKAVTKLREELERYSDIQTRKYFGLFKRSMRR